MQLRKRKAVVGKSFFLFLQASFTITKFLTSEFYNHQVSCKLSRLQFFFSELKISRLAHDCVNLRRKSTIQKQLERLDCEMNKTLCEQQRIGNRILGLKRT